MAMLYLRNKPIGVISDGASSGGHVIENASGTDLTQRDTLQFSGYLQATDDSTNEKSVVSDAPSEVEYSVWQTMTDAQKTGKKWIIKNVPKTGGTPTDNSVSVTADGVKTCSQLLNELFALIDKSKITRNTCIRTQNTNGNYTMYSLSSARPSSDVYYFVTHQVANQKLNHYSIRIASNNSILDAVENGVYSDYSSDVESSGYVYALYYNLIASPGVGDIDAGDVAYGSGTVEDSLDGLKTTIKHATVPSGVFSYSDNEFSIIGENVSVYFYATISGTLAGNSATICTLPDEAKIVNTALNNGTRKVVILGKYNNAFGVYVGQVRPNGTIITATGGGTFSGDIAICGSYVR